jgi:hypothetical protein
MMALHRFPFVRSGAEIVDVPRRAILVPNVLVGAIWVIRDGALKGFAVSRLALISQSHAGITAKRSLRESVMRLLSHNETGRDW